MAIDLTEEQKTQGKANFDKAARAVDRRGFLKTGAIGATALGLGAGAAYFGYQSVKGNPVRAALIGAGDEGGVLVGEHNPEYLRFVAVADIRPTNMDRVFAGEGKAALRKGFDLVYGEDAKQIKRYRDWEAMLRENKDIEAVVIALPLHLHAPVAIAAMRIGKERGKPIHVLCEKLMAWNVKQCKQMIRVAKETGSVLSIGHQRHYSMLYEHAQEVLASGVLGDIKHIRALWHRNISWDFVHDAKKGEQVAREKVPHPTIRDGWYPPVLVKDYEALEKDVKKFGYEDVAQLIRWRLHAETGGGLMAELGSHQLDAASIFLGKVKPLSVQGTGVRSFYDGPGGKKNPRDIDDHVFVTYTFPGKSYYKRDGDGRVVTEGGKPKVENKDDVVVVTYSSISTNQFENYGECLMGMRGTMLVEREKDVMLFTEAQPGAKGDPKKMDVSVDVKKAGAAKEEASSTWGGPTRAAPAGGGAPAAGSADISRGYREEMEDFAYCVRQWDAKLGYAKKKDGKYEQRLPRCHGEVAMADAIVALAANAAMKAGERIAFEQEWFDGDDAALPKWDGAEKIKCDVALPEKG